MAASKVAPVEITGTPGVIASNGKIVPHLPPEFVVLSAEEMRRIPSPGTQRALQAETGRTFDELCGPAASQADRMQTMIWAKLRREYPGLRWEECAEIGIEVPEGVGPVDPTVPAVSTTSPPSADSGG